MSGDAMRWDGRWLRSRNTVMPAHKDSVAKEKPVVDERRNTLRSRKRQAIEIESLLKMKDATRAMKKYSHKQLDTSIFASELQPFAEKAERKTRIGGPLSPEIPREPVGQWKRSKKRKHGELKHSQQAVEWKYSLRSREIELTKSKDRSRKGNGTHDLFKFLFKTKRASIDGNFKQPCSPATTEKRAQPNINEKRDTSRTARESPQAGGMKLGDDGSNCTPDGVHMQSRKSSVTAGESFHLTAGNVLNYVVATERRLTRSTEKVRNLKSKEQIIEETALPSLPSVTGEAVQCAKQSHEGGISTSLSRHPPVIFIELFDKVVERLPTTKDTGLVPEFIERKVDESEPPLRYESNAIQSAWLSQNGSWTEAVIEVTDKVLERRSMRIKEKRDTQGFKMPNTGKVVPQLAPDFSADARHSANQSLEGSTGTGISGIETRDGMPEYIFDKVSETRSIKIKDTSESEERLLERIVSHQCVETEDPVEGNQEDIRQKQAAEYDIKALPLRGVAPEPDEESRFVHSSCRRSTLFETVNAGGKKTTTTTPCCESTTDEKSASIIVDLVYSINTLQERPSVDDGNAQHTTEEQYGVLNSCRAVQETAVTSGTTFKEREMGRCQDNDEQTKTLDDKRIVQTGTQPTREGSVPSEPNTGRKLRMQQKQQLSEMKPELSAICEILQVSETVAIHSQQLLSHVMNTFKMPQEPRELVVIVEASLCLIAGAHFHQRLNYVAAVNSVGKALNLSLREKEFTAAYKRLEPMCSSQAARASELQQPEQADTAQESRTTLAIREATVPSPDPALGAIVKSHRYAQLKASDQDPEIQNDAGPGSVPYDLFAEGQIPRSRLNELHQVPNRALGSSILTTDLQVSLERLSGEPVELTPFLETCYARCLPEVTTCF